MDSTIENDINLVAVGELARGAGPGLDNFVLISVGTGVGMGIVINRSLHVGARGAAGEVSYLPTGARRAGHRGPSARPTEALVAAGGVVQRAHQAGLAVRSAKEVFAVAATWTCWRSPSPRASPSSGRCVPGWWPASWATAACSWAVARALDVARDLLFTRRPRGG